MNWPNDLKVALAHDWLTNLGGGERVLLQLHHLFPDAPIYTSVFAPEKLPEFNGLDVRTSFLQHWPLANKKHQLFPTLRTEAFESFDFSGYDLVISSSSAEAKGIITNPSTIHISYLHTPTRYYWSGYHNYMAHPGFGALSPIIRWTMPRLVSKMREWDFAAAQRPDYLLANSNYVAARVEKYYRRPAEVIYPPVEIARFDSTQSKDDYFLVVSRLIPYKQVDLAIQACNKLKRRLLIAGDGTEREKLEKLAGPTVKFLGRVSDQEVSDLLAKAAAFIFTPEEDFGIAPVEAMASGCPVIAYGKGGALESVVAAQTGVFFNEPTVESLVQAINRFDAMEFDTKKLRARAEQFSNERFRKEVAAFAQKALAERGE